MKSPRATKINPACGRRPSGEVLFRRRPRSRRSSNKVAPSAGGGGGARDLRSRFSSSSPVRRVVSAARLCEAAVQGEKRVSLSRRSFIEPLAMLRIAGLCAQAQSASGGWAQGRIFSVGDSLPSRGGWPRGRRPLGCVLCLLSVASQKVGAPAARAGERKEIDSP